MKTKMKFFTVFMVAALALSFAFTTSVKKTIVIDAGHGGSDFGATIEKQSEKQIVASIAKKIRSLGLNSNIKIVLLRAEDSNFELSDRIEKINNINPDLLISLHVNASKNQEQNGIEAYVNEKSDFYDQSLQAATNLVEAISNENLAKKEVKNAKFYLLRHAKCPALILEMGYLSNKNDREYISSSLGQDEIAKSIFEVIEK